MCDRGTGTESPNRSNIEPWFDSFRLASLWARLRMRPTDSSSPPRGPKSSRAPALIRLSSVLVFMPLMSASRHMRSTDSKVPSPLDWTSSSVAPVPTFLIDDRPNRMRCEPSRAVSMAHSTPLRLTLGPSTAICILLHSTTVTATLSVLSE